MDKFTLKKSYLERTSTFITIDCGIALIKYTYVDYEDDGYNIDAKEDSVIFTCKTLEYSKGLGCLIEILKSRKTNLECFETILVLITGIKSGIFHQQIKEQMNCEVKIISEMEALAHGLRYIINDANKDHFIHLPETDESFESIDNNLIIQMMDSWKKKMELENRNSIHEHYPILYASVGASTRYITIDEFGDGKEVSFNTFGGETFLGLSKCLLDDNNFDSLLHLAENGNRSNIDTQVKEVLDDIQDSPYGYYPPDLPVFAFGKAMDVHAEHILHYRPEDVSQSLVSMILENATFMSLRVAIMTHCKYIYLGGNLFQHKAFRKEYTKFCKRLPELIKTYFLKTGIESNIGLLLWNKHNCPSLH